MHYANQAEKILADLQAGKEAHTKEQQKNIFIRLNQLLGSVVKEQLFAVESEFTSVLNEVLETVVVNGFAVDFTQELDPEIYYKFGEYLLNHFKDSPNQTEGIIYNYLDLFRHSGFLQQIYKQNHWPVLIQQLVEASNYTVQKNCRILCCQSIWS